MYKLFIVLVFFLTTPTSYSAEFNKHPNIENSVFRIYNYFKRSAGTTFYIGNNLFVTNAHIVLDNRFENFLMNKHQFIKMLRENPESTKHKISKYLFIEYEKGYLPAKSIVALDFVNDLAIIEVDSVLNVDFRWIPFGLTALELKPFTKDLENKKAYAYGFPDKKDPSIFKNENNLTEIILKSISSSNDLKSFDAFTNIEYVEGASGSPVLFDGKVIGVLRHHLVNLVGFASSNALQELLRNPLPKPLTKIHEITEEFIKIKRHFEISKEKNWMFINFLFSVFKSHENPSVLEEEELRLLKRIHMGHRANEDPTFFNERFMKIHNRYLEGLSYLKKQELDKNLEVLKEIADQHYNPALYILGLYHYIKGDDLKYTRYMKRASLRGHLRAQIHLDLYYYRDSDVSSMHFSKLSPEKAWAYYGNDFYKRQESKEPNSSLRGIHTFYDDDLRRSEEVISSDSLKKEAPKNTNKGSCQKIFKKGMSLLF